MKVLNISKSFKVGGAAIAAYNIHLSLLNNKKINSYCMSQSEFRLNNKGRIAKNIGLITGWIHQKISNLPTMLVKNRKSQSRSCNLLPTNWHKYINDSDFDVVIVHWVGSGGLSIGDLLKIEKTIVWVLHDMWFFCGSEHVSSGDRYIHGYDKSNKPKNTLIDIDRFFWKRKKMAIDKIDDIYFIAPSQWMLDRAKQSKILKKSKISIINVPIDVEFWKHTSNRENVKAYKHLNSNVRITFGSSSTSRNKGLEMFIESLKLLSKLELNNIIINYVGLLDNNALKRTPFNYNNHGFISSNNHLREVYQDSDICVFPSYIESFGQMAAESSTSGAYVVAYSETGVSDFIKNDKNGVLFNVFSKECLADAIKYSINRVSQVNVLEYNDLTINKSLSMKHIGKKYSEFFNSIKLIC